MVDYPSAMPNVHSVQSVAREVLLSRDRMKRESELRTTNAGSTLDWMEKEAKDLTQVATATKDSTGCTERRSEWL